MGENAGAGRSDRIAVIVKETVEVGMGRKLGVQTGSAQEIEGPVIEGGPRGEGVSFRLCCRGWDEMVLERPDCAFGGVSTMDVGRDELEIGILRAHELFEDAAAFIAEAL